MCSNVQQSSFGSGFCVWAVPCSPALGGTHSGVTTKLVDRSGPCPGLMLFMDSPSSCGFAASPPSVAIVTHLAHPWAQRLSSLRFDLLGVNPRVGLKWAGGGSGRVGGEARPQGTPRQPPRHGLLHRIKRPHCRPPGCALRAGPRWSTNQPWAGPQCTRRQPMRSAPTLRH